MHQLNHTVVGHQIAGSFYLQESNKNKNKNRERTREHLHPDTRQNANNSIVSDGIPVQIPITIHLYRYWMSDVQK
jgi:hypothetical protein